MTSFTARSNKDEKKASAYFSKMHRDLDLGKYKLAKYKDLFELSSFQTMYDADLAYHTIYSKCAENAFTKQHLLDCLQQEETFSVKHPEALNPITYRHHTLKVIKEIRQQR